MLDNVETYDLDDADVREWALALTVWYGNPSTAPGVAGS